MYPNSLCDLKIIQVKADVLVDGDGGMLEFRYADQTQTGLNAEETFTMVRGNSISTRKDFRQNTPTNKKEEKEGNMHCFLFFFFDKLTVIGRICSSVSHYS